MVLVEIEFSLYLKGGEMMNVEKSQKGKSIKVKLLFVPLIVILVGVFVIGAVSSVLTKKQFVS